FADACRPIAVPQPATGGSGRSSPAVTNDEACPRACAVAHAAAGITSPGLPAAGNPALATPPPRKPGGHSPPPGTPPAPPAHAAGGRGPRGRRPRAGGPVGPGHGEPPRAGGAPGSGGPARRVGRSRLVWGSPGFLGLLCSRRQGRRERPAAGPQEAVQEGSQA